MRRRRRKKNPASALWGWATKHPFLFAFFIAPLPFMAIGALISASKPRELPPPAV